VLGDGVNRPSAEWNSCLDSFEDPQEKTPLVGGMTSANSRRSVKGLNTEFYDMNSRATVRGVNVELREMPIVSKMSEHEEAMLKSLHQRAWSMGFQVPPLVKEEEEKRRRANL
jgi:hypothetical protein